MPTKSDKILL